MCSCSTECSVFSTVVAQNSENIDEQRTIIENGPKEDNSETAALGREQQQQPEPAATRVTIATAAARVAIATAATKSRSNNHNQSHSNNHSQSLSRSSSNNKRKTSQRRVLVQTSRLIRWKNTRKRRLCVRITTFSTNVVNVFSHCCSRIEEIHVFDGIAAPQDVFDYCSKLFVFETITVKKYRSVRRFLCIHKLKCGNVITGTQK